MSTLFFFDFFPWLLVLYRERCQVDHGDSLFSLLVRLVTDLFCLRRSPLVSTVYGLGTMNLVPCARRLLDSGAATCLTSGSTWLDVATRTPSMFCTI